MTDYSKMSDKELNGVIAEKRGWEFYECIDCGIEYWISPDGGIDYNQSDPPDYTRDWRLCGELLAEIPNCSLRRWGDKWCCGFYDDNGYLKNQANVFDSPLRAICEAWLPWWEEQ